MRPHTGDLGAAPAHTSCGFRVRSRRSSPGSSSSASPSSSRQISVTSSRCSGRQLSTSVSSPAPTAFRTRSQARQLDNLEVTRSASQLGFADRRIHQLVGNAALARAFGSRPFREIDGPFQQGHGLVVRSFEGDGRDITRSLFQSGSCVFGCHRVILTVVQKTAPPHYGYRNKRQRQTLGGQLVIFHLSPF